VKGEPQSGIWIPFFAKDGRELVLSDLSVSFHRFAMP